MALTQMHFRFLWGAVTFDAAAAQTPSYAVGTDYATLGASAAAGGGVGVRRATLTMRREAVTPTDDVTQCHFDFLNFTGGAPDDTWTSSDFTTLEGYLNTWWNTVRGKAPSWEALSRILWHRVGPGIALPNPAERILDITTPLAGIATSLNPPQVASSITFRTGLRRHWGRTYVPLGVTLDATGRITAADCDTLCTATQTLFQAARAADFMPVVVSSTLNSALGIENIEVDNTVDIIRRRRWKHTTYRKLLAA